MLQWHISISLKFFFPQNSFFFPCSCILIVKIVNNLICLFDLYLTWWHHLSKLLWLVNVDQGLWKRRTGLSRDFLQNGAWYELLRIRAFTPTHRHFAPFLKCAKKIAPCSQWKPRWHAWCGWIQHDCFWIFNAAKSKTKQSKAKENKSNTNKTKHLLAK